jgi:putative tryptophan/tyrosine transport system substrate-binding protein
MTARETPENRRMTRDDAPNGNEMEMTFATRPAATIPVISGNRSFAEAGALMTFGSDLRADFLCAAWYVAGIFKGAKPADLPVEQSTKFELVINLKTAKVLGLTIPQSLLGRVDQVIQ